MSDTRSRTGILFGLTAAVGAFGAAAMMSAATAPTARADDFTDVINAIDGDYAVGQTEFGIADTDFSGGDVNDGLAALFSGVDDDFVAAPSNLYVGTVDLLANDPVAGSLDVGVPPESDFTTALALAETVFAVGQTDLTSAATDLSSGDYAGAAYLDSNASIIDLAALQVLFEGAVGSL
jgi:hypothetical protein